MLSFRNRGLVFILICAITKLTTVTTRLTEFILIWTLEKHDNPETMRSEDGQYMSYVNNCPDKNCYITHDKQFFGDGKEDKFDAILFHGRNLHLFKDGKDLPQRRASNQKYIFVWAENVCNSTATVCDDTPPICNAMFDNFFNWTATYRKKSDLVFSMNDNTLRQRLYKACRDNIHNQVSLNLRQKKNAVVWFAPNCTKDDKQLEYVYRLKKSLRVYDQMLNIYGCGDLLPKYNKAECDILRDEYFFYLDFDSFDTEISACPFARNSVPIVYGSENYSKFMPLGTFIDAAKYSPESLATTITFLVNDLELYSGFFTLRDYRALYVPGNAAAYHCLFCAAVNNERMMGIRKVYPEFRAWWNKDYRRLCNNK